MGNIDVGLKQRQVKIAQQWIDETAKIRPKLKGKKVVAVDSTENHAEAIVRFNDWTTAVVVGLEAKIILSGKDTIMTRSLITKWEDLAGVHCENDRLSIFVKDAKSGKMKLIDCHIYGVYPEDDEEFQEERRKAPDKLFGFPVESADWLLANKAMIFGKFGAIITDLQTGESKVASKEDLEKALRNITKEDK